MDRAMQPMSKEDARKHRYGIESFNPKGQAYQENRCAFDIARRYGCPGQCLKANGFGPEGIYCRQHAKVMGYYYDCNEG